MGRVIVILGVGLIKFMWVRFLVLRLGFIVLGRLRGVEGGLLLGMGGFAVGAVLGVMRGVMLGAVPLVLLFVGLVGFNVGVIC